MTLLAVSKHFDACARGRRMQQALHPRVTYACLADRHFSDDVVMTQPYEQLSHAALSWLLENQQRCDVLQVTMLPLPLPSFRVARTSTSFQMNAPPGCSLGESCERTRADLSEVRM